MLSTTNFWLRRAQMLEKFSEELDKYAVITNLHNKGAPVKTNKIFVL